MAGQASTCLFCFWHCFGAAHWSLQAGRCNLFAGFFSERFQGLWAYHLGMVWFCPCVACRQLWWRCGILDLSVGPTLFLSPYVLSLEFSPPSSVTAWSRHLPPDRCIFLARPSLLARCVSTACFWIVLSLGHCVARLALVYHSPFPCSSGTARLRATSSSMFQFSPGKIS